MKKDVEKVFANRANWNKLVMIAGIDEYLIYISAKNELRKHHSQNGYTVDILVGFYVGNTLAIVNGEWE